MKKTIKMILATVAGLLVIAGMSLVRVSLTDITYSNLSTEKALLLMVIRERLNIPKKIY